MDKPEQPEWVTIDHPHKVLYSTEDIRQIIGANNTSTIRMAVRNGRITPTDTPGRDLLFSEDEVQRFAGTYKITVKFIEKT